ncbi:AI-2E family transporter [Romboutsia maritimum]|uniref:AI-2E family transporter n=1 Tax=Romboutsia maritimum TaxID=2020948 RepID=A0A371IVR5_9FIRM|nr:AI-2E family transporter [Romboutsia maritimum]RDY24577.1 AI-2E family transporter [Romboutsia maritimum]
MKINWNGKYTTMSVYTFIVVCCSIIFYNIISQFDKFSGKIGEIMGIFQPFIIGFVMAYLLNFILKFYEEKLLIKEQFKSFKKGHKRGLGLLLTYSTALLIVGLFMQFVVPQLVDSVSGLVNDIPRYAKNLSILVDDVIKSNKFHIDEQYLNIAVQKLNELAEVFMDIITNLFPIIGDILKTTASSIWNIILGLIISIYMLIDKENFYALGKKMTFALFNEKHSSKILELTHRTNNTFGKFLSGKIIDSSIIGVLTFVVLTIFKMPYILLISVIIGITNIIPFFGPFFGAIPSAIIILFVSPIKALWFLLIIVVIQQLDGNFIGPKILGDSIGISAFWILFSLLVAGKVLGLVGMIIGVPLFAVIYSIIKDIIEAKLDKKGLPSETSDYMNKYE